MFEFQLDSSFSPKHLFQNQAWVILLFRLSNPPRKKQLENAEITLCQLLKDGSYERFPTGDFWGMGAFVSPAPLDNKNTSPPQDSGWLHERPNKSNSLIGWCMEKLVGGFNSFEKY